MNQVAKVGKRLRDFYNLTLHKNCLNGRIQDVTKRLDLGRYPRNSQSKRLCFLGQRIECSRENFDCLREYNGVIRKVRSVIRTVQNDSLQLEFSDIIPSTWLM